MTGDEAAALLDGFKTVEAGVPPIVARAVMRPPLGLLAEFAPASGGVIGPMTLTVPCACYVERVDVVDTTNGDACIYSVPVAEPLRAGESLTVDVPPEVTARVLEAMAPLLAVWEAEADLYMAMVEREEGW